MCGIVGYVGHDQAQPFLLSGLAALEYRGYDSAGLAVVSDSGQLRSIRRKGRVAVLAQAAQDDPMQGSTGIAHTRWATHGVPSERNAHPFRDCSGNFAVVHNGIIENYAQLRDRLVDEGHCFTSDTDTEVVVHLVEAAYRGDLLTAVRDAVSHVEGAYALAVVCAERPGEVVVARKGSPLVLASTPGCCACASDLTVLLGMTHDMIMLADGQVGRMTAEHGIELFDAQGTPVTPEVLHVDWDASSASLGGWPDFMAKEISEQPEAVERLLEGRLTPQGVALDELDISDEELRNLDQVYIVACGTSYHAGLYAKRLIEAWAHIRVEVDVASEFNYREALADERTLCIVITQSGETADTLMAARKVKSMGAKVLAVTNVLGSTAAREADATVYLQAGPEVSVASTKAYTAQLVAMALVALFLAQAKGVLTGRDFGQRAAALRAIPGQLRAMLDRKNQANVSAALFENATSALFLGRGFNAASAEEGALKLKEVSYLHAEAYAAGEMKHGPIALLEPGFPVLVVVPDDSVRAKTISNIAEIKARGAMVCAVATEGDDEVRALADRMMWVPPAPEWAYPVTVAVALQQLAREVALARGCDIDKPRNLAKSVTTE